MEPKTLSASAASTFEDCERRYKSEYIDRAPDMQNAPAALGSACHEALELWINTGQYQQPWPTLKDEIKAMQVVWDMTYHSYFTDREFYEEGWNMLEKWVKENQNTFRNGRTVISTEQKNHFMIPTSKGDLQVNYIMDRLDQLDDGMMEVVDYKSVRVPIQPERMKHLIQPRLYALATMIEYPGIPGVWVTYDLLRYNPVSVKFTRDECIETWNYMKDLAERIYASDGSKESLNRNCRFCIRRHECDTLMRHAKGGGILGVTSMDEVIDRLSELQSVKTAIDSTIDQLQDLGLQLAEDEGEMEWETDDNHAKITAKGRRSVDSELASKVLGPEIMARYGIINVGTLEKILDSEDLSDVQRSQLKQLMRKKFGNPKISVTPKTAFEDD